MLGHKSPLATIMIMVVAGFLAFYLAGTAGVALDLNSSSNEAAVLILISVPAGMIAAYIVIHTVQSKRRANEFGQGPSDPSQHLGSGADQTAESGDWYYISAGNRTGPITESQLQSLYRTKTIGDDTLVWRQGLPGWTAFHAAKLARAIQAVPVIPPQSVNNLFVWCLAFFPILFAALDAAVMQSSLEDAVAAGRAWPTGSGIIIGLTAGGQATLFKPAGLPGFVLPLAAILFCWGDEMRLRRAGYTTGYLLWAAMLITPIYLFMRAARIGQTPYYGFVWMISFVIALFIGAL